MGALVRLLAQHRNLRLVLVAGLISQSGDWMLRVGLVYHVYAVTGSTGASAVLVFTAIAPQVLLGPLAGVFVDRWDRQRVMVVTNLVLAAALAPLLAVHGVGQTWIFFVVMALQAAVSVAFAPAEQALLPRLVPDADLVAANALYGQNQNIARLVGSALGGLAAAVGGVAAVTLSDAFSFLLAAALIAAVSGVVDTRPRARATDGPLRLGGRIAALGFELSEGLLWIRQSRVVRALALFALVTSTGEGVVGTLFAPFVRTVLHGSSAAYGTVVAAQALGGIAGGLLAATLGRTAPPARLFGVGAVVFGAVDLAIFLYPLVFVAVWPAVVGMVVVGLPGAFTTAGFMTLFQRGTEDRSRGRVFSAIAAAMGLSSLAGVLGAGLLTARMGIVPVIAFQGAAYMAAGAAMLALLRDPEGRPSARGEAATAAAAD